MDQNIKSYVDKIVNGLNCGKEEKSDIAEEMMYHLRMLKYEYIGQGFSEIEASQKAIHSFGNTENIQEGLQSSLHPGHKIYRFIIWSGFCLYSLLLLWNLLFVRIIDRIVNYGSFNRYFWFPEHHNHFFDLDVWKLNSNLIPFQNIFEYISGINRFNLDTILYNTVGNILILFPLGIFVSILLKTNIKLLTIIVSGLIFSFSLKTFQFLLQLGQFDIDDILLYTLGIVTGYVFIRGLIKVANRMNWKFIHRII